jgi:hypothetical protein
LVRVEDFMGVGLSGRVWEVKKRLRRRRGGDGVGGAEGEVREAKMDERRGEDVVVVFRCQFHDSLNV